jgi:hypothetical protein
MDSIDQSFSEAGSGSVPQNLLLLWNPHTYSPVGGGGGAAARTHTRTHQKSRSQLKILGITLQV